MSTVSSAASSVPSPPARALLRRGLGVIAEYVRMHPLPFTLAVLGAGVYAAMTVGSAVVLGRVTDSVLTPAFQHGAGWDVVAAGAVAVVAVALLRAAGIVCRRWFAGMTHARVQRTLRTRVVDRYVAFPLAYFRTHPTGELMAHAESDVEAATDVLHPLPYSTAVVLLVVFALVSLVLTDPFLALVGGSVLPVLGALNRVYGRRVEAAATQVQRRIGLASAVAHESIDGALVVKTLGRERAEVQRFAERAESLRQARVEVGRRRAGFEPALDALPDVGIVLLLGVGAWRVASGAITTGTLVQFVSLFQLLAFPLRLIGFMLADIPRSVVGRERLQEVFDEPLPAVPTTGGRLPDGPLGLRVEGVDFAYGDAPVLRDLDLEVRAGETVALVGATGSGKSTLLQLLAGLSTPDRGRITLGGVDVAGADPASLRAAAAIVLQEAFLFASTVRDNVTLDLPVGDDDVAEAMRLAQADFIDDLPRGGNTIVGERGVTLSGGQRQRVALARALVRRPRLLLLDDATSAVDPTVEAAILAGLRRDVDATLVIVAHRVSTIALADRVLLLENGRITASGSHRELLANPRYAAMVRAYERSAA